MPLGEINNRLNADTAVIVMLETAEGIDNAEAIAALPGIDVLLIGSGDLTTDYGIPGQVDHPRLREAYERVAAACRTHGKVLGVGGIRHNVALQGELIRLGARFVIAGTDVNYVLAGARQDTTALRAIPLGKRRLGDLLARARTGRTIGERAVVLRGFARAAARAAARRGRTDRRRGAVPQHDHPRRVSDVGGDDQLRPSRLGDRPQRVSLRIPRPETGRPGRRCQRLFRELAADAAEAAGFPAFEPDACLLNRYEPGTRLSLHRDENERDLTAPIVSVSLGLPAVFLFGGKSRSDRPAG